MKTVAELEEFANRIGEERSYGKQIYQNILNELQDDESVTFCCNNAQTIITPPEIRGKKTIIDVSVLAVTNKRLIVGGKTSSGWFDKPKDTVVSMELKKVKKMRYEGFFAVIETLESTYSIKTVNPTAIKHIGDNLWDAIEREQNAQKSPVRVVVQESVTDEIKKFKELLDMGAITQEEFDAKKKQLLGL